MRPFLTSFALLAIAGCPSPDTGTEMSGGTTGSPGPQTTADPDNPTMSGAGPTTNDPSPSDGTTADPGTTTTGANPTTGSVTTAGDETSTGGDASTSTGSDATTDGVGESTGPEPWMAKGCPDIYKQDILPTFELEISASVLSQLEKEWDQADDDNKPDHPLKSFKYEDTVITNASIRLRGNDKWWFQQNKMQFEVGFNTYDKKGRFMGLRKVLFDAARYNESFMRDRLALKIMRDVGLPAPCANNARLVINGKYYGLFTSIEKIDKEFLERYFEDPEGNLYKRYEWAKKTNESDPDTSDLKKLIAADNIQELDAAMNLDEAILLWAADAMLPNNDGPWAGGLNFYVYNDSKTGFNVLPWDLDATFDRIPYDVDPYTFIKENDQGRPFYKIATDDPVWFKKYIEALAFVLETGYDVPTLQGRIDEWAAQIKEAVETDPNRPFSMKDHLDRVKEQREYVAKRAAFVKKWLECWQDGGTKGKDGKCDPP